MRLFKTFLCLMPRVGMLSHMLHVNALQTHACLRHLVAASRKRTCRKSRKRTRRKVHHVLLPPKKKNRALSLHLRLSTIARRSSKFTYLPPLDAVVCVCVKAGQSCHLVARNAGNQHLAIRPSFPRICVVFYSSIYVENSFAFCYFTVGFFRLSLLFFSG